MKAQTVITMTVEQTEEEHEMFQEFLKSPSLSKNIRIKYKEMLMEIFKVDTDNIEVDFKAVE